MKVLRNIWISVVGLLLCIPAGAQRQRFDSPRNRAGVQKEEAGTARRQANAAQQRAVQNKNRVQYNKNYMKQVGDSLVVDMDIDMTKLGLKTNHAQILTPVITSSVDEIELPPVMVQGTVRNKAFARELALDDEAYNEFENNLPYAIVKPKGRLNYRMAVPYESWMSDASLYVEEDLCGCGDKTKVARTPVFDGLTKDIIPDPVYRVRPQLAYVQPEVEPIKRRHEIGNAYLEYPRGRSEILPNFGPNAAELDKIDRMIATVAGNRDVTVNSIEMIGYASPESSEPFNLNLSRARSEALMRYFRDNSSLPSSLFRTRTGGEDWNGLRVLLENYPVPNKEEILYLMNTIGDLDAREKAITQVGGGRPYKMIYEDLYPKLRRVVCEVNYTVRDFSLEEAKTNLKTAPHLLSLNEMYIVANTYEVGSPEFLKVFEIAREEFPDDPVANLNGAAAALAKNNLRDAERFLKQADPATPEYKNNMGVFQMLKGNYDEAERMLRLADREGIPEASANLRELRKKVENVNNRREAGVGAESDERRVSDAQPNSRRRRAN